MPHFQSATVSFPCPRCGKKFSAPSSCAGKAIACGCGVSFSIPATSQPRGAAPPRPTALPQASAAKPSPVLHRYYPWMQWNRKGLFVFLLDQSAAMDRRMTEGERWCDQVALSLHAWLENLVIGCARCEGFADLVDVCVLGYRTDPAGEPIVEPAFIGPLAGKDLVPIEDVANSPARCDTAQVIIPDEESGEMLPMERQVPVWVEPIATGESPLCSAIAKACEIVDRWIPEHRSSFPPIVLNITSGLFSDGDPAPYADALKARSTEDGHVLFFNCYVSASTADPFLFPGSAKRMPDACARHLFEMSSMLPDSLVSEFRWDGQDLEPNARGMAYNADMVALLRAIRMGGTEGPRCG
jgi:hypothetical protein